MEKVESYLFMRLLQQHLLLSILSVLIGCQQKAKYDDQNAESEKPSLARLELQHSARIDSLQELTKNLFLQEDFSTLYAIADSSMTAEIEASDLETYFAMVDIYYGDVKEIELYGTAMTAEAKSIDYKVFFEKGDSLELHTVLSIYNDDVKFSYISYNPIRNAGQTISFIPGIMQSIDYLSNGSIAGLCEEIPGKVQKKISLERCEDKIRKLIRKLNVETISFTTTRPTIFSKGNVGFVTSLTALDTDNKPRIIYLIHFYQEGSLALCDIRVSSTDSW